MFLFWRLRPEHILQTDVDLRHLNVGTRRLKRKQSMPPDLCSGRTDQFDQNQLHRLTYEPKETVQAFWSEVLWKLNESTTAPALSF